MERTRVVIPLTKATGGDIWLEDPEGTAQCPNLDCNLPGKILELPASFQPPKKHCAVPWAEPLGARFVLVAFSPKGLENLACHDLRLLRSLGFKLPRSIGV